MNAGLLVRSPGFCSLATIPTSILLQNLCLLILQCCFGPEDHLQNYVSFIRIPVHHLLKNGCTCSATEKNFAKSIKTRKVLSILHVSTRGNRYTEKSRTAHRYRPEPHTPDSEIFFESRTIHLLDPRLPLPMTDWCVPRLPSQPLLLKECKNLGNILTQRGEESAGWSWREETLITSSPG